MNRKPLVTVLMGSYNPRWDRLRRAVESLRRQTLEDWELVLWDDGSCPRGAMALEQAAGLDNRVRLYRGRENRGLGYALTLDKLIHTEGTDMCFRPLSPGMEGTAAIVWKKYQVFTKAADTFLRCLKEQLPQES